MTYHELKILPAFFDAVVSGEKRFEIRDNSDRGFQKGDTVALVEIEESGPFDEETGNAAHLKITYVSDYNQPINQVVFSFEIIEVFHSGDAN